MEIEKLIQQNPWWKSGPEALEKDPHLLELKNQKYAYDFEAEIRLEKGIYVFRGPRQVGKTTWLKTMIRSHLKGKSGLSVFFYSCDLVQKPAELADILNEYYKQADLKEIKEHVIFLDEVTTILEWGNAIKYIANIRDIKNDIIVITGSSAIDLRKGAERLPGRNIEGKEHEFLPLSLRGYAKLTGKDMPTSHKIETIFEKGLPKQAIMKDLSSFFLNMTELNKLFADYLQSGGFLKTINSYKINGIIENNVFEIYARWIESDISKAHRNSTYAKQVAMALLEQETSTFSLSSIAKKTSLQTHVSAGEYISLFEDMMLINNLLLCCITQRRKIAVATPLFSSQLLSSHEPQDIEEVCLKANLCLDVAHAS